MYTYNISPMLFVCHLDATHNYTSRYHCRDYFTVVHSMRREENYAQVDLRNLSDHSVLVDVQMLALRLPNCRKVTRV